MKSNKLRRSMRLAANELAEFVNDNERTASGRLETDERIIAERVVNDLRWLAGRLQERWRE